jgi:PEP-CTERM motif
MSRIVAICILLLPLFGFESGLAQGFINLNFESANIPAGTQTGSFIPISDAFPGWTAFQTSPNTGSNSLSAAWYDLVSTGGEGISVNDANAPFGFGSISGKYSAYLFSGNAGNVSYDVGISQTGLVPSGTESLQFQVGEASSPFKVTLGGETINVLPLANFSTYTLYGGNVSSFAGQAETLTLTETFPTMYGPPGILSLDNILFSTMAVPEPTTFGLLVLGGAIFFGWRRRHGVAPKLH